jgi:hypothetical protein
VRAQEIRGPLHVYDGDARLAEVGLDPGRIDQRIGGERRADESEQERKGQPERPAAIRQKIFH